MDNEAAIRVLVIDDNPTSAGDLASFLTAHHYDVSTCSALDGAKSAVSSRRPHVLVLATKDRPHAELRQGLERRIAARLATAVKVGGKPVEVFDPVNLNRLRNREPVRSRLSGSERPRIKNGHRDDGCQNRQPEPACEQRPSPRASSPLARAIEPNQPTTLTVI